MLQDSFRFQHDTCKRRQVQLYRNVPEISLEREISLNTHDILRLIYLHIVQYNKPEAEEEVYIQGRCLQSYFWVKMALYLT